MSETISVSPAYYVYNSVHSHRDKRRVLACPRLPTEIPCEPLHHNLLTWMFVLFGLKAADDIHLHVVKNGSGEELLTDTVIVVVDP